MSKAGSQGDELYAMRHSLAHIMATAVEELWPGAKLGVGPVVENGFYYDVDLGETKISEEDFVNIEAKMQEIIKADQPFERFELPIDEAVGWAKESKQPYKQELLSDLKKHGTTVMKDIDAAELGLDDQALRQVQGLAKGQKSNVTSVSFYRNGSFTDLCRGPHVESTGKVGAFKLMRVAGAYWRGKETNPQMQRIYGVGFATKDELSEYLNMLEEAEKRDHRKLGVELDLFSFSDLIGPGLPLWTPRGTVLRKQLDAYVQEMRNEYDYQEVAIPHITKKDAYIKSGHWAKFANDLFKVTSREGHEFAMKPMNCPHHTQIYAAKPRSYRELPIRYRETSTCYRDEQSGELSGLSRVRAFSQDDAHVFCRSNQIEAEVLAVWDIIERFYRTLDFELSVRFSRHDPANMAAYSGEESHWKQAEAQMKKIIEQKVADSYEDGLGEAAFYGPKIDFMAKDAIGRTWQVATIQLDFNQPEGFDLTCINEQNEEERIVMIHAAIMGSIERFLSVYIEHSAGKFPVWLAPEQVRLVTVNDSEELEKFAKGIAKEMKEAGVRASIDLSNESVGKKIRAAELYKVPYTIVVGEKELEGGKVTPRVRQDLAVREPVEMGISEFIQSVANEAKSRASKASL